MEKNNIIVLNPSLKDVLQNHISVLQHANQTFYVPLWHSELHYRVDLDKQLIVKCMPVLPDHMSIDVNNELHIDVRADIKELLHRSGRASSEIDLIAAARGPGDRAGRMAARDRRPPQPG